MRDTGFVLEEMKRVCKPGGKVIIITDNAGFYEFHIFGTYVWPKLKLKRLRFYKDGGSLDTHCCLFSRQHFINHFKRINWKTESIEYLSFPKR